MTKRKTHFSEHQIRSPILPQPPNPPSIPQNKWQDIIHKQEHDILILEIREEILQKAFETYNKIHNDKKIARLLTDCALESWRRIVSLYFFQKDQPQLLEGSDATDEPCRADCVAGKNIPLNFTYTVPQSGTPKFSTDSLKSASQQGDKLLSHSEVQLVSSCSTMSCEELESMEEDYCFEMNEETFRDSYETFGSDLSDFSKLKLLPELQPEKRLQKLTVPKKRRRNTRLHRKDFLEQPEVVKELGSLRTQVKVKINDDEASGEIKSQSRLRFESCPHSRHASDRNKTDVDC